MIAQRFTDFERFADEVARLRGRMRALYADTRAESGLAEMELTVLTAVVNAAVGTDYTEDDLHRIANRIVTMTHDFNAARGIGRESETLPEWVTEKPMEDEEALTLPHDELAYMLGEYYKLRGWDEKGVPTAEKLADLALV